MAYRITTSRQRDTMNMLLDRHRRGRHTFVGPDPDTGQILWGHLEVGVQDVKYIQRDGTVTLSVLSGFIDQSVWDKIAGKV